MKDRLSFIRDNVFFAAFLEKADMGSDRVIGWVYLLVLM